MIVVKMDGYYLLQIANLAKNYATYLRRSIKTDFFAFKSHFSCQYAKTLRSDLFTFASQNFKQHFIIFSQQ